MKTAIVLGMITQDLKSENQDLSPHSMAFSSYDCVTLYLSLNYKEVMPILPIS